MDAQWPTIAELLQILSHRRNDFRGAPLAVYPKHPSHILKSFDGFTHPRPRSHTPP
jgi:hypothetical protein